MAIALLLSMMVVVGIVWYWQSPQKAPSKKARRNLTTAKLAAVDKAKRAPIRKTVTSKDGSHKYHSVSIRSKDDTCAAAKEIANQRFLPRDAPAIPLPNCDAAHCHCNYAHHSDRRANDDERRGGHGLQTELYSQTHGNERRNPKDRREDDDD